MHQPTNSIQYDRQVFISFLRNCPPRSRCFLRLC
uniref:Uncharacterized protein n=1 Tax=Tetranychus urticae TaxID=32264 RepID=T1KSN2_TETUR